MPPRSSILASARRCWSFHLDLSKSAPAVSHPQIAAAELSAPCDVFLRKAQAARDAAAPGGPAPLKAGVRMSSTGLRVISCAPGDTLQTAIDLLCDNGVHRVFVVDTQGAPTGVISLTDVIRTIIARE